MIRTLRFVETVAGATYTARTSIPKGARLLDILMETTTAWTAATAPLDIGDSDATDALVKGCDLAAQQGIVVAASQNGTNWGNGLNGSGGPYSVQGPGKLYPTGSIITAVITPTVPGGPTGVSRISLLIELAPVVSELATVA